MTTISYELPESIEVTRSLLDATGHPIRVVDDGPQPAGVHTIAFDAIDLASGVFF